MRSKHHLTGLWRMCAVCAALCSALVLSSCAKKSRARIPQPPKPGETQTGVASWYGEPYDGRRAANGEIYDMHQLTAAHRTWPFDTFVRVTNLSNQKEVDVRITDRGPFVDGRIIDLSLAAAEKIEMIGPGTTKVRLKVLRPTEVDRASLPQASFAVQAGAFRDRDKAENMRAAMEKKFGSARVIEKEGAPPLWRVLVGHESSLDAARQLAVRVRKDVPDAVAVRE